MINTAQRARGIRNPGSAVSMRETTPRAPAWHLYWELTKLDSPRQADAIEIPAVVGGIELPRVRQIYGLSMAVNVHDVHPVSVALVIELTPHVGVYAPI